MQSYVVSGKGVILTQAMGPELSGEITPHAGPQLPGSECCLYPVSRRHTTMVRGAIKTYLRPYNKCTNKHTHERTHTSLRRPLRGGRKYRCVPSTHTGARAPGTEKKVTARAPESFLII